MTRLSAICALIKKADVIADVGCDHGRVAEYIVKHKLSQKTIASDISESCLSKAKTRLNGYDGVEFICCDGIGYECDEAVIAGMGGHTVIGILNRAAVLPDSLIICAHRNTYEVRGALVTLGYGITADITVEERRKFYSVIRAEKGKGARELTELQRLFGVNYAEKSEPLEKYLLSLQSTYMRAADRNEEKLKLVRAALICQGVTPDTTN
ncbi:MAG: SAM-dependent methyltransferase [Clostridiales bacterium]|nr:SAM-dependent methyltransferase [Clostridiales bacterium]